MIAPATSTTPSAPRRAAPAARPGDEATAELHWKARDGRGQELVHPLTADSKPRARGQARIAAARIAYSTVSPYSALT